MYKFFDIKKTFTTLFFIQSFCWVLSSCHKEITQPVTIPLQLPVQQSPVKEIVNNNLQWGIDFSTRIAFATLAFLHGRSISNSADSIVAVYVLADSDVAIRRDDPGNYTELYYQVEKNSIILHKKYPETNQVNGNIELAIQAAYLPRKAKVVFR
jgi:hypothetical protein